MKRLLAKVLVAPVAAVLVSGCSTGDDAVAQGGTFEFVAPGGQTDITYDPPESRGKPGPLSGPDLMDLERTISLSDFAGQVTVINSTLSDNQAVGVIGLGGAILNAGSPGGGATVTVIGRPAVVVYPQTLKGWRSLCRLLTAASVTISKTM